MNELPTWQKPIAWAVITMALPFVGAWCAYRRARRILWAARIYFPNGSR